MRKNTKTFTAIGTNHRRARHFPGKSLLACVVAALLTGACTGGSSEENGGSQLPSDQTDGSSLIDQTDTELGQEPDFPVNPSASDSAADKELVFADENGLSETEAEAPVIDEDQVEVELEQAAEAPQVAMAVSEAALCASVQIGRDAVVDGDERLAAEQRDLLIDRADRVSDTDLSKILKNLNADTPLDRKAIEAALAQCVELGFEV